MSDLAEQAAIYALAIMERDRTIAALQAEIRKLKPYCAVCGRTEPCETDQVACTFDPSPRALYADNLRLRAEVERLTAAHDWQYRMAGERLRRVEKLEAKVEALRVDAARVDPPPIWEELTKIGNEAPPGTWECGK